MERIIYDLSKSCYKAGRKDEGYVAFSEDYGI